MKTKRETLGTSSWREYGHLKPENVICTYYVPIFLLLIIIMLNFVAVFAAVCRARFLKHNPPATIRYGHKRTRYKSGHQMSAWVRNANFLKFQQSYRSRRLSVFLHWFVIIADLWRANNKLEKRFLQPATAFENEQGPFADPAGWYMRCNKTIFPFSLVVHSWAHSQRASFAKLCCVRRDGIIVLAYTTPVG